MLTADLNLDTEVKNEWSYTFNVLYAFMVPTEIMFYLLYSAISLAVWSPLVKSLPRLTSQILRSVHAVRLCVWYGSQNKQHLFHYTALTDGSYNWDGVFLLRGATWNLIYNLH